METGFAVGTETMYIYKCTVLYFANLHKQVERQEAVKNKKWTALSQGIKSKLEITETLKNFVIKILKTHKNLVIKHQSCKQAGTKTET